MAKILIKVGDQPHEDEFTEMQMLQHGDVVAVAEDDHVWGRSERSSPNFRDIDVPGAREDWVHLLDHDPATITDFFPLSILKIPGMMTKLSTHPSIRGGKRSERAKKINDDDTIERKISRVPKRRRKP